MFFDRPGRREAAGGHGTRRQQSRRRIACQRLCLRPPRPTPCPPLPQHGIGRVVELGSFGFSKARLGKVTLVEWLFCEVAESRAKKYAEFVHRRQRMMPPATPNSCRSRTIPQRGENMIRGRAFIFYWPLVYSRRLCGALWGFGISQLARWATRRTGAPF